MIAKRFKGNYSIAYRPCRISEIYGQEEIKKIIGNGLDNDTLANSLLFYGISGTGKTSIERIIAMGIHCAKGPTSEPCCECDSCQLVLYGSHFAFQEFDAAHFRGIDHMRKVVGNFDCAPLGNSKKKIIVFDEAHQLTKDAQNLLLKVVEDSHSNNHFIFCSTEPKGIIETLRNRCMSIEFKKLPGEEMLKLLFDICKCEGIKPDPDVFDAIIKETKGMPRNALFSLQEAVLAGKLEKMTESIKKKMELVKSVFKGNNPENTLDTNL